MICNKCRTDLPDESVACYRCGTSTSPDVAFAAGKTFARSTKTGIVVGGGAVATVVVILLIAGAVGVGAVVYISGQRDDAIRRQNEQIEKARGDAEAAKRQIDEITRQQKEREIRNEQEQLERQRATQSEPEQTKSIPTDDPRTVDVNIQVNREGSRLRFVVPKGGGTLSGRLEGEGGIRGEFSLYIMTDKQLKDYRNGLSTPTVFSQEGQTVQDVNVRLDAGEYYLYLQSGSGWTNRRVVGRLKII